MSGKRNSGGRDVADSEAATRDGSAPRLAHEKPAAESSSVARTASTGAGLPPISREVRPTAVSTRFPDAPRVGEVVGDCRIVEKLGEGGMGVVYKAVRQALKRTVALKVLPPSIRDRVPGCGERFVREAQSAARLHHPHIVTVYNAGEHDGLAYIEMQFVLGVPLSARTADGPMNEAEAVRLIRTVARALGYAHDEGVIHRDIKPANVILGRDGEPRVSDFGLAGSAWGRATDGSAAQSTEHGPRPVDALTQAGAVLGTVPYMSPQQLAGEAVDHRADIYALGATLHHLLTGELPFDRWRAYDDPLPDLSCKRPDVSEATVRAVHTATAQDPADRYAHCEALARALTPDDAAGAETGGPAPGAAGRDGDAEFWHSFSRLLRGAQRPDHPRKPSPQRPPRSDT